MGLCCRGGVLGWQRSEPISHLDKESLRETSARHLTVIPRSTAENSAIITIQTDCDGPARVHRVRRDLCSTLTLLL